MKKDITINEPILKKKNKQYRFWLFVIMAICIASNALQASLNQKNQERAVNDIKNSIKLNYSAEYVIKDIFSKYIYEIDDKEYRVIFNGDGTSQEYEDREETEVPGNIRISNIEDNDDILSIVSSDTAFELNDDWTDITEATKQRIFKELIYRLYISEAEKNTGVINKNKNYGYVNIDIVDSDDFNKRIINTDFYKDKIYTLKEIGEYNYSITSENK